MTVATSDKQTPEQAHLSAYLQQSLLKLTQDWSKGQTSLKRIMGLSDEELYAIGSQGYYLFLQGKTQEAKVIFEGLLALDPRNAYYFRALGAIYWRLKQPEKAIRQFTYAIRVSPRDISSYVNRAEVYVATGEHDKARADLDKAINQALPSEYALVKKARAILQMIG